MDFLAKKGIQLLESLSESSSEDKKKEALSEEEKKMLDLQQRYGCEFPESNYHPSDRKNWMAGLVPGKLHIKQIVWPGTHNSATNKIACGSFAECQSMTIYEQLVNGARVLDIRVQKDRRVCHGKVDHYSVDVVINDVKRFLSETDSEIIILQIRTEHERDDPKGFEEFLVGELRDYLIQQDDHVFDKTVSEVLPKRVICVWKPKISDAAPKKGAPLWSSDYLKDDWIDTDLPYTKFESNLNHLAEQPPVSSRKFFYRVENTLTTRPSIRSMMVKPVTNRIHGYARLFINRCFARNIADQLQIFSTDFIDEAFVDACVALTRARIQGNA